MSNYKHLIAVIDASIKAKRPQQFDLVKSLDSQGINKRDPEFKNLKNAVGQYLLALLSVEKSETPLKMLKLGLITDKYVKPILSKLVITGQYKTAKSFLKNIKGLGYPAGMLADVQLAVDENRSDKKQLVKQLITQFGFSKAFQHEFIQMAVSLAGSGNENGFNQLVSKAELCQSFKDNDNNTLLMALVENKVASKFVAKMITGDIRAHDKNKRGLSLQGLMRTSDYSDQVKKRVSSIKAPAQTLWTKAPNRRSIRGLARHVAMLGAFKDGTVTASKRREAASSNEIKPQKGREFSI